MCKVTVTYNDEKNGIELRFEEKPEVEILSAIKAAGYRWSSRQKMWYARRNDRTIAAVQTIGGDVENLVSNRNTINREQKVTREVEVFDLWGKTRFDKDESRVDKSLRAKDIAALIRNHIKPRFPMCRFSVRTDRNSIDIDLLSSPFDKDSEEAKAITEYVFQYAKSYKYCVNYDPYGDYGSESNFYGVYNASSMIGYRYEQTEETAEILNIRQKFAEKKAAWEKEEEERKEREFQEYLKQREEDEKRHEAAQKIYNEHKAVVDSNMKFEDADFWVLGAIETTSKLNSMEEYEKEREDVDASRIDCKVKHILRFTDETAYNYFTSEMLMESFDCINGHGRSSTTDNRINHMTDFYNMTTEERETVKWFSSDCIALYLGNELKAVIDPQGYSYCRYVFLIDEETEIKGEAPVYNQVVSNEEAEKYHEIAESLTDVSAEIIVNNGLGEEWNTERFDEYKEEFINYLVEHHINFDKNVIRALDEDMENLRSAWYKIAEEVNGMQFAFKTAGFERGKKMTLFYIDPWIGGLTTVCATFDSVVYESYAQNKDAVKLIYRKRNGKVLQYDYFYDELLIYDGWQELPKEVLFEKTTSLLTGMICYRGKFRSCDTKQLDAVEEYFNKNGMKPILKVRR